MAASVVATLFFLRVDIAGKRRNNYVQTRVDAGGAAERGTKREKNIYITSCKARISIYRQNGGCSSGKLT